MTGTLVVAIVALGISTSTLTWQVVHYALSASRPQVNLRVGALNWGGAITGPASVIDLPALRAQGADQAVLVVEVRNRGRLATSVTGWSIKVDNGASFSFPGWKLNEDRAPLPHRLEPGAEVSFLCPLENVDRIAIGMRATSRPISSGRATASFGDGRTKMSKDSVRLPFDVAEDVSTAQGGE